MTIHGGSRLSADRYGGLHDAPAEAVKHYCRGVRALFSVSRRAVPALDAATEADPGFPGARALRSLAGRRLDPSWDPGAELAAIPAARYERASAGEMLMVDAATARVEGAGGAVQGLIVRHVAEHPGEIGPALVACEEDTLDPGRPDASQLHAAIEAHAAIRGPAQALWMGWLAARRQLEGEGAAAAALVPSVLDEIPECAFAVHILVHAWSNLGEHDRILSFLGRWLPAYRSPPLGSHLHWHVAIAALAMGRYEEVRTAYHEMSPGYPLDLGRLLWASRLAGDPAGLLTMVSGKSLRQRIRYVSLPLSAIGAVLSLAAIGDREALRDMAERSAQHDDPSFRAAVAPWPRGLSAFLDGNLAAAREELARASEHLDALTRPDSNTRDSLIRLVDTTLASEA